jgi:nitrite reductase/ring-hydroxylating ferredoxin subunit
MLLTTADQWTPVALSVDVPKGTVVPAWIPSGRIALWRSQSGALAASSDRCPHRGMRLSYGFVRGETLSCIYHGWSFASNGRCQRIPAHPGLEPPETINLQNSVVDESGGIIWVALEQPKTQPPAFNTLSPLRTVMVAAGMDALEKATGSKASDHGVIPYVLKGETICLLPVAKGTSETLIHILVDQDASITDRISLSRVAEGLRRRVEAIHMGENA